MKKPSSKSVKDTAKDAIAGLVPDGLVENAKASIADSVKGSITGAVPESLKSPVEKLLGLSQPADVEPESDTTKKTVVKQPQANAEAEPEAQAVVEDPPQVVQPPPPEVESQAQDDEPEPEPPAAEPISLKLALFGGAGIGLLFGVIMGMSVTPTVGTVLGALTAMLAGILGLNDSSFSNAKAARVGGFGFACVLGAFLGLFVRSHNAMAPSLLSLKQEYIAVGFTEAQSLAFIAQKAFGASLGPAPAEEPAAEASDGEATETAEATDDASQDSQTPAVTEVAAVQFNAPEQLAAQHSSLLFSADVDISSCEEMENTDDTLPLDEVINNFELTGDMWEVASIWALENIAEEQQKAVMLGAKDAICGNDKIDHDACEKMLPLDGEITAEQIADEYNNHTSWTPLSEVVAQYEMADAQKTETLLLIKHTVCGVL